MITAMAVAALTAACSDETPESKTSGTTSITFAVTGDFTLNTAPMTRALSADGKDMTDIWVLDYVGGELKQQLHQLSSDEDFGMPTLSLAIGTHHIYFVASRGTGTTIDTDARTLAFGNVRDTFWKDYEITITSGTTSSSRQVALDRIVTKLKVIFTDAIPTGAATFNITPSQWFYGIDYTTGEPTAAETGLNIPVAIPSTEIGNANVSVNIYGFSPATQWQTDIAVNCKAADNSLLGSATIANAPFVRNRVSEYSGPLFSDSGSMTLSLNTDWSTSYTGSW